MKGEKKVILMIQSEVRSRCFESQPRNPKGSMMMKFEEKHEGSGSLVGKRQPYLGEKHQGNLKPEANEKAEASMNQEANGDCCEKLRQILNRYSWQEIQKHNQKAEQWIVISRKVYNVTGWANRHPGGHRILNYCAGEDATGISRNWWNHGHFQRHVKPNICSKDQDINLGSIILFGDIQPVERKKICLTEVREAAQPSPEVPSLESYSICVLPLHKWWKPPRSMARRKSNTSTMRSSTCYSTRVSLLAATFLLIPFP
ncbi:uncharacterized protein LOC124232176 [Equus quagga]|uniref:uncharacterized protein LOC124232176 n=1 Tax=Equus quagga TaxID=89248 RepID=UPI001EE337E6|nr:uncharacterized protein LOC124232176 [Equus quagga]